MLRCGVNTQQAIVWQYLSLRARRREDRSGQYNWKFICLTSPDQTWPGTSHTGRYIACCVASTLKVSGQVRCPHCVVSSSEELRESQILSDVYNGQYNSLLFPAKRVTDMLSPFSRMESVSFSHFSVFATLLHSLIYCFVRIKTNSRTK